MTTESAALDNPAPPRAAQLLVDGPALHALDDHLAAMMGRLKRAIYKPAGTKPTPVFNAAQLAKLCGKSASTMLRHLEKAADMKLADGLAGGGTAAHRAFTLEQSVDWVRALGGPGYKRLPGQPGAVITVGFFKGGVGKTIVATSLAQGLALKGYKVLTIDFDPQGSMTAMMGVDPATVEAEETFAPLGTPPGHPLHRATLAESIRPTYWSGVDLVAGSTNLFQCEFFLPLRAMNAKAEGRQFNFLDVLAKGLRPIREDYDFIIIDTPPALSYTTMNAYLAADALLMPVVPEGLSLQSSAQFWDMFTELFDTAAKLTETPKQYAWLGIVPSKVEGHKPAVQAMLKWIRAFYGEYVLASELPQTDVVKTGGTTLGTVFDISKYVGSNKTYERAREAFDRLVTEIETMTRRRFWNEPAPAEEGGQA